MGRAQPLGRPGRPSQAEAEKGSERTFKRGETADYLAARIKRDRPDIAEAVERGEYSSMRQAAIADVHRAQAHALAIRARAEMRLAEEYDAAQDRGEIRQNGERSFSAPEKVGHRDLNLAPKDLHEARLIRDAERAEPGVVQKTIDRIVERGEEPTRAALKREIGAARSGGL